MDLERQSTDHYSLDEGEVKNLPVLPTEIPDCDGIPCRLWTTKVVTLHNANG